MTRLLRTTAVLTVAVLALGAGWVWLRDRLGHLTVLPRCSATALGNSASLEPGQAGNAALITAVAVRRGLPARAATIGIATALQESKLRNLGYGDRDSLGLFQQRPSQGWGTAEEVMDPVYATNAFYDVLVKVEGYQSLPITKAAQRVQRSGFPTAYADHEDDARVFASALSGYSEAALVCSLRQPRNLAREQVGADDLTPRARAVVTAAAAEAGRRGVSDGSPGGTGITFALAGQDAPRLAWALAHWAVARADALAITEVAVDGRRWRREDGAAGWAADSKAPGATTVQVRVATGG
jgi:hypothetical protein